MPPDYGTHDPKGWCGDPRRGAALGRGEYHPDDPATWTGRLYLREVRLNSGGYDRNGTYFGVGAPLYWYASADCEVDGVLRARDRADARAQVLALFPMATVRR